MITFISPTKNMKPNRCALAMTLPVFCAEAEALLEILKTYNDEDIMNIMKVNAKLALQNEMRFQQIRFDLCGTHALFTYDGLAFQSMHLSTWQENDILFAQDHLRILSGFYGVVRPLDSIYPYRLEMQAKGLSANIENLYAYWSDALMRQLQADNQDAVFVNLASKEYSQAVTAYLNASQRCIDIDFRIMKNGQYRIIATQAKMARGRMVEYIMKHKIDDPKQLTAFQEDGWRFCKAQSTPYHYVFLKD